MTEETKKLLVHLMILHDEIDILEEKVLSDENMLTASILAIGNTVETLKSRCEEIKIELISIKKDK
jgi:hypothetical protein|tara:strand:- start:569 stop:766 length:198 start_codon:yes stop_codon:yes gene_type:complete